MYNVHYLCESDLCTGEKYCSAEYRRIYTNCYEVSHCTHSSMYFDDDCTCAYCFILHTSQIDELPYFRRFLRECLNILSQFCYSWFFLFYHLELFLIFSPTCCRISCICNITLILIFIYILIFSGIYITIYQNHILLVNKAIKQH